MHITLEADYAVRIVERLTIHPEIQDAKTISNTTKIPLRFSLKILRNLVSSKIIRSYKGSRGGYTLNKKPSEITLKEVIEAVEGPYFISRCLNDSYCCEHTRCKIYHVYDTISDIVRNELDKFTFDMLLDDKIL